MREPYELLYEGDSLLELMQSLGWFDYRLLVQA